MHLRSDIIIRWHRHWLSSHFSIEAAVAGTPNTDSARSKTKSCAPKLACCRERGFGGGRRYKALLLRRELYEWFTSIRYAIDWKQSFNESRSHGLKNNLARFPRSLLKYKVYQLLQERAHSITLNRQCVQTFKPSSSWFKRCEEEYGLSMRAANRTFQVPRHMLNKRLELV